MPLGPESSSVQRPFVRYAVAAGVLRKTAKLVQKHPESGAIEDPTKFQALWANSTVS